MPCCAAYQWGNTGDWRENGPYLNMSRRSYAYVLGFVPVQKHALERVTNRALAVTG